MIGETAQTDGEERGGRGNGRLPKVAPVGQPSGQIEPKSALATRGHTKVKSN
jgi:hypothetical protein